MIFCCHLGVFFLLLGFAFLWVCKAAVRKLFFFTERSQNWWLSRRQRKKRFKRRRLPHKFTKHFLTIIFSGALKNARNKKVQKTEAKTFLGIIRKENFVIKLRHVCLINEGTFCEERWRRYDNHTFLEKMNWVWRNEKSK